YLLNSTTYRIKIQNIASGSSTSMIKITKSSLLKLEIVLPSLPEQCKIAEILGAWDDAISTLEKLITAKRKLKQGLMQQLLTGKTRFKEFEGSEWETVKLSEIATIRRGASPRPIKDTKWFAETGRGWVRISDVTASDTYLIKTSQYLSRLGVEKSVKVDPGDLIMSICATIGVPRIVGIPACIHDGFVVFRDFEDKINKFFLYHYINLIAAKLENSGQPGTQKNLNTGIVGDIEIIMFPLSEQEKIASVLSAADAEISTLEKQLAAYKQQKRGLMQQLLTGKTRVKIN
ncbi:MAG: restriction endonuclease subunit S, partial [Geitlerinemataceae cyanobacterium]